MHVPLLSVHCSHCRKCIYALDHHCYFLGHCIGRGNQRFFIVFCLYAAIGSAIGRKIQNKYTTKTLETKNLKRKFYYHIEPCYHRPLLFHTGVYNMYQVMSRVRNIASREFSYYLFPFTTLWYCTGNRYKYVGV